MMETDILLVAAGKSYNWRNAGDIDTKSLSALAAHLYFAREFLFRELSSRRRGQKVPEAPPPKLEKRLEDTIDEHSPANPFCEPFEQWLTSDDHKQSTKLGKFLKTFIQDGVIEPSEKEKANTLDVGKPAIQRASKLEMFVVVLSECMGPAPVLLFLYAIDSTSARYLSTWELCTFIQYFGLTWNSTSCFFFEHQAHLMRNRLNVTVHDKYNSSQLNFSKLNPGSRIILALVVSFGGHKVSELIFKRFLDRQFRLSPKGDKTIAELGWANEEPGPNFTKNLMYQLTDNWESIQTQLLSRPWFKVEEIWDPIRKSYSLLDGVRDLILKQWADETCRYWHRIAFQLICHVFPRDTVWEPSFQTHGEALAPCLDYIMDYFSGSNLSPHMRLMLAESLVAKAKLGRQYSPEKALEDAKNLLKDDSDAPQYMRAALDLQRSILE